MARIVVTEFVTLDGVAEDPGGSEGTARGGWATEFGEGGERFKLDETLAADAQLLGRRTYEGFAQAWPTFTGEFADTFNSMPKYVYSSTLTDPTWTNSTVVKGDLTVVVERLKRAHPRDIVVHGSIQLARGLLERQLVDELRLMVFPIVLGQGKRLFAEASSKRPFELTEAKTVGNGVQILIYRPAS